MKWTAWAAGTLIGIALVPSAYGQARSTVKGAEIGLVGIKLYDTGIRLVNVFGNPDEIQPVNVGGGQIGPTGGGAPGGGGRGGFGPGGAPSLGGGGGAPGGGGPSIGRPGGAGGGQDLNYPIEFGDEMLRWQGGPPPGFQLPPGTGSGPQGFRPPSSGGPGGPTGGGQAGFPGRGGVGPGAGAGAPGVPGVAAGSGAQVNFTRWVYNRNGSKYGFVLDKFNRIVQIEAIGLKNGNVKTAKGLSFGSTFRDVITRYQAPDAYEINGNVIVMRYLSRNKIAFRLSQLGPKKPHVVTGIVVAAAKG
ncbi:MAG: hypothetical protein ACOYON_07070 [Fimbriimonas sp.]